MRKLFLILTIAATVSATAAITVTVREISSQRQQKQYKKINVADIPKETLDKVKKGYGNYTIKEASKADDGEYKLVLTKDGIDLTATFTPAGDMIKILN